MHHALHVLDAPEEDQSDAYLLTLSKVRWQSMYEFRIFIA